MFFVDKEQNDQNDSIIITNQFKLQDLQFNSNEKILDIIELMLGENWEQRIHKAAAISHVLVNLAESKISAIYAPYYCSACNHLLSGKDELLKHARSFHPHIIKKNEIGEPTQLKLKNANLRKIGDSRMGKRLLTATIRNDRLARTLLDNDLEELLVRQPEPLQRRCRVNVAQLPDFDDIVDQLVEENRQEDLQL